MGALVKVSILCAIVLVAVIGAGSGAAGEEDALLREIAPTGKLRVGVVFAPLGSAFFVTRDGDGRPRAITAALPPGGASGAPQEGHCASFPPTPPGGTSQPQDEHRTLVLIVSATGGFICGESFDLEVLG